MIYRLDFTAGAQKDIEFETRIVKKKFDELLKTFSQKFSLKIISVYFWFECNTFY